MRIAALLLAMIVLLTGCGVATPGTQAGADNGRPAATTATIPDAPAESTPDQTAGEVLAVWTRSGGFAGFHDVLTVFGDGRVTLDQKGSSSSGQAASDTLARLEQALQGSEWQQLEPRYGEQHPDAFQYKIESRGKAVETFDGADNPAILDDLLQQFAMLANQIQAAPTATATD